MRFLIFLFGIFFLPLFLFWIYRLLLSFVRFVRAHLAAFCGVDSAAILLETSVAVANDRARIMFVVFFMGCLYCRIGFIFENSASF